MGERWSDQHGTRYIWHAIDGTFGVGLAPVDGWRRNILANRSDRHDKLERAGGAQGMSVDGFRGGNRKIRKPIAEDKPQRLRFRGVIGGRPGSMRIDVIDFLAFHGGV